eukprot:3631068-Prymnesium_polylepis.1
MKPSAGRGAFEAPVEDQDVNQDVNCPSINCEACASTLWKCWLVLAERGPAQTSLRMPKHRSRR